MAKKETIGMLKNAGASALTGGLTGIVGQGLGAIFGAMNDRRQLRQQQKLTDMQQKANQEIGQFNHGLAMDMWNKTNYGAQMEHIKEAGLNPALIYGNSGAGGSTVGGNASGVSGGQAANAAQTEGMALQHGMMQSQINLQESQARKNNAEADDLEGLTNPSKEKLKGMQTERWRNEIKLWIESATKTTNVEMINKGLDKLDAEIFKLNQEGLSSANEAQFLQQTFLTRVEQMTQKLFETKEGIKLTKAQIEGITNWMTIESKKLDFAKMSLDQQKQIVADTLSSMIEGKWIDAGSRIVGDLIQLLPNIKNIFGKTEEMIETWKESDNYDAEGNQKGSRVEKQTVKRSRNK